MNKYIKMFMDDHDLQVGEKFRKKGTDAYGVYSFDEYGQLRHYDGNVSKNALMKFILGEFEVEKLKKEPWKPTIGEYGWHVCDHGNIIRASYWGDKDEKYFIYHRLVFKTKEEAEDYKWFLGKVDEYKKPFEYKKSNCRLDYSYCNKEVGYSYANSVQIQGTTYFGDKENIENFIDEVGEDRIKKYMFGIYE